MKELVNDIQMKIPELLKDMQLNVEDDNKSAGKRARKTTRELEKMFKQYRKLSVEAAK